MHNELFTIGSLTIYGYGTCIAIGALLGILIADLRAKKESMDSNLVFDVSLWGLVAGLIGAKLTHILSHFGEFLKDPKSFLTTDGFVVYGGVILGILAGWLICRIKKVPFLKFADLIIPSISIGQGFGRIGCFLAGCCYGKPTDTILGVFFPAGSSAPSGVSLLPTQLFSSAGNFLIFAALLVFYRYQKQYWGRTTGMYLVLYGVGRFIIEFFRGDTRTYFGPLSSNQYVSILFVLLGLILIFVIAKKQQESEIDDSVATADKGVLL